MINTTGIIILGIAVLLVLWIIAIYNGLIKLKVATQDAASGIVVILKQRADMIPQLVETVKGYAAHEAGVFQAITEARANVDKLSKAGDKVDPSKIKEVSDAFGSSLSRLLAVAEAYPDLKANVNFQQLQSTIEHTENNLQQSRRFFNGVVREYETKRQVFPNVIFSGLFGFKEIEFFDDENKDEMAKGLGTTAFMPNFTNDAPAKQPASEA